MKISCNATLTSAVLLSLCLVTMIPAGLRNASTWRDFKLFAPGLQQIQNYLVFFGFFILGFVMIGLIVLWTGYRKRERWAWFVMLIILLCFVFPFNVLPVLMLIRTGNLQWSYLLGFLGVFLDEGSWHCLKSTFFGCNCSVGIICVSVAMQIGLLKFLVMLIALLLPVKAFFWKSHV
jgi:hypothetical protein